MVWAVWLQSYPQNNSFRTLIIWIDDIKMVGLSSGTVEGSSLLLLFFNGKFIIEVCLMPTNQYVQ